MDKARDKLHVGLTDAGKVFMQGVGFVVLASLVVPAFGALAILLAVCVVALAVGFILRPRVRVTGNLPDRIPAGQTARLTYTLENTGRLTAYCLSARFLDLPEAVEQVGQAEAIPRLEPRQTASVTLTIRPKRRGCHQIGRPICESSFPFNLFRIGMMRGEAQTLLVLPAFSWMHVPLRYISRHVNTSSRRSSGHSGNTPEYIGSRPFMSGDSPRRIDVRAWARLAAPATKEYDDDLDDYAAFVLDTRVPEGWSKSKSGEIPELEAAVSLCASVAYSIGEDCLIDVLLAGPERHEFTAYPKGTRLERIHEILAGVEPSEDYSLDQIGPFLEGRLGEISEIVFIVLRWDPMYQRLAEWSQRAGCHTTVVVIGKPDAAATGGDWAGDVRFLPADEILAGRVEQL
ncbi:MAG: DUF58 domain-containing protein [Phycisphaerales bacterium]